HAFRLSMEPQDIEAPRFCRGMGVRGEQAQPSLFRSLHEKSPAARAFFLGLLRLLRDRLDVDGLIALRAGSHIERHLLVFLEGLEAAALDRGEAGKEILAAAVGSDEPETLGVVERLDRTSIHL